MKKKSLALFFFILLIIVVLIIWLCNRSRNYSKDYMVDGYRLIEEYNKEFGYYSVRLNHNNNVYEMILKHKYVGKKLINKINVYESTENFCVLFKSEKLDTYPVCTSENNLIDYGLIDETSSEFYERKTIRPLENTFNNLKLNYLNSKKYLVWAHDGYYYIDGKNNKKIDLLKEEIYYNNLAIQVDEYVLTPNYNQDHTFNEIYVMNLKNGKMDIWELEYEINFNSYFIGVIDGRAYIVDRKNEVEYSLNPKKHKQEIVSDKDKGVIWKNGWEKVSMVKLINNDYFFEKTMIYDYRIENQKLMLNYLNGKRSIMVSLNNPTNVVTVKSNEVYYLVDDTLYLYSPFIGEIELIKYSEWEFNNMNSIFIY